MPRGYRGDVVDVPDLLEENPVRGIPASEVDLLAEQLGGRRMPPSVLPSHVNVVQEVNLVLFIRWLHHGLRVFDQLAF